MKIWFFVCSLLIMVICVVGETTFSYTLKWLGHYIDAEKAINSKKVIIAICISIFGSIAALFAMSFALEFFLKEFGLEQKSIEIYFFIFRVGLILLALFIFYQGVHLIVLKGVQSLGIPAMNYAFSYVFWFVAGLSIAAILSYLTPSWGETFNTEKLFWLAVCIVACGRIAMIDYQEMLKDEQGKKPTKTLRDEENQQERFFFMPVPRLNETPK